MYRSLGRLLEDLAKYYSTFLYRSRFTHCFNFTKIKKFHSFIVAGGNSFEIYKNLHHII